MNRTVTALYETRAQAEQVKAALEAAHMGDHVDIRDESENAKDAGDFGTWLKHLLGGHEDTHVYVEGVRRGHFLLSAKVDELKETRAAEILDAATPIDLNGAQDIWRTVGWAPEGVAISSVSPPVDLVSRTPQSPQTAGLVGVRVYRLDEDLVG